MRKLFVLTAALIAALFAAPLLLSCDGLGIGDNNTGGNNTNNPGGNSTEGATMTWSGDWMRVSDTKYSSIFIGDLTTIERLEIAATRAGTVTIQITASCDSYSYGYASKLDTGVSTSDYQMRVSGTQVATHTYAVPAGTHWIQFMYEKDEKGSYDSFSDSVTVEIISSSFTSSNTDTNSKLKVQNESSVTLADVKWGNAVVSASLDPGESKTVDVAEGSGYLYFTKGSADGLKCRTQEVIAVTKDETKELVLTNNTLVVALDDTNNPQALGTIEARVTRLTINNQSSVTLADIKWGNTVVSASLTPSESKTVDVAEGSVYLYFTKGSASDLKCRTQEVITVAKDETKELTLTNNTLVVALDDTNNPQTLETIGTGEGAAPSLTWTGNWTRVSENKYTSNTIGHSANTIERLDITASSACTVTIQITASCSPSSYYGSYDYGYMSKLDTGVSPSDYQMRVTGTGVATYAYTIPAGSHWIQFMYQKDQIYTSGSDSVTVEVISIN